MRFALFLPPDDISIAERTASLADWCHGFMHGLVAAGGADEGPQAAVMDVPVVAEILEDFSEITKAGADPDASAGEQEVAESAYAELTEYVRVSAQLVYDETAPVRNKVIAGGNA